MRAAVGDRIVVVSGKVSGPVRDGEVVEVRNADGSPPYTVRWDDGHEGLFFPGPDAVVRHETEEAPPASPAGSSEWHVKTWHVDLHVFEGGDGTTSAHAVLRSGAAEPLDARGETRRNPRDSDIPEIGDEVAAARALRRLADRLLGTAEDDIRAVEKHGKVHLKA